MRNLAWKLAAEGTREEIESYLLKWEAAELRVNQLTAELAELRKRERDQRDNVAELRMKFSDLQAQRDEYNALSVSFRADCERLTAERDRIQARYTNVCNDRDDLQAERDDLRIKLHAYLEVDRLLAEIREEGPSPELNQALREARERLNG